MAGGILALFISPLYIQKEDLLKKYLTPGIVISCIIIIILAYMVSHHKPQQWDEFTHWGPLAKIFYYNNGFVTSSNMVTHKSYPPGGPIFYYFFMFFSKDFSIGKAYSAQLILQLAPLVILFGNNKWKSWKKVSLLWLVLLICLVSLYHFSVGFLGSLYMDFSVSFYWAGLVNFYLTENKNPFYIFSLLIIVASTTLFKAQIVPLIFITLMIIGILMLLEQYKAFTELQKTQTHKKLSLFFNNPLFVKLLCLVLVALTSIAINYSWNRYLHSIDVPIEWSLQKHNLFYTITSIFSKNTLSSTQSQILFNFFHHFPKSSIELLAIPIVISLFNLLAFSMKKDIIKRIIFSNVVLTIGAIIFLFGLLIMYIFSFSTSEALNLASFNRYSKIYSCGWFTISFYFLSTSIGHYKFKFLTFNNRNKDIIAWFFLLFLLIISIVYSKKQNSSPKIQPYIVNIGHQVNKLTTRNARIAIVWQNDNGLSFAKLRYYLAPRPMKWGGSFGKPYGKQDSWTKNILIKKFIAGVSNYQYLLLAYTDKNFWQHYGTLFKKNKQKLVPLTTYKLCNYQGISTKTKGCHLEKSYLFRIIKTGNLLEFINVFSS